MNLPKLGKPKIIKRAGIVICVINSHPSSNKQLFKYMIDSRSVHFMQQAIALLLDRHFTQFEKIISAYFNCVCVKYQF